MNSQRRPSVSTASAVGYALLLLAFVTLGLFVAALATGSALTVLAGTGLIACLFGSVTGFRAAARRLADSVGLVEPLSPVSIFSIPLRQHQIDRYRQNYTLARPDATAPPVEGISAPRANTKQRENVLLSA